MKENTTSCTVKHAHDMVLLFEAVNSNPNGDPDAGGAPRMKPGTNIGQVSSGCLKRKFRTAMQSLYGGDDARYAKLYFDTDLSLNAKENAIADQIAGFTAKELAAKKAKHPEMVAEFIKAICEEYADLRLYGAVLTQSLEMIQGPIQVATAESVAPIEVNHMQLTRRAIADDKGLLEEGKETMFGERSVVPYGLYRAHIYVTPEHAEKTGMTQQDLEYFIQSSIHMFDNDKSSARPDMRVRALYDFEHLDGDNTLRYRTVESLTVTPVDEVANGARMAEAFSDFTITVDEEALPDTICVHKLL